MQNDYFNRMINWFASEVDIEPDEVIGHSIFPAGDEEWNIEVFDGRERVSANVWLDENGDFNHGNLSYR